MKLTKAVVKQFENDQTANGTKVAISNLVFVIASDLLHGVGVKNISVSYHPRKKQCQSLTKKAQS